jgi:predicted restriction endonuclease
VTGLDVPELLRASHIRPWAQCETDEQRLDVFNGLLLAPHLDALFDAGLMTVTEDSKVEISSLLSSDQRSSLGLQAEMAVAGLSERNHAYLSFHRLVVWRG